MTRQIAFDVTHLVSRLPVELPSGIDKVDLAYARHLAARDCAAVHYGLWRPRFHASRAMAELARIAVLDRWAGTSIERDAEFARVRAWLTGRQLSRGAGQLPERPRRGALGRRTAQVRWRLRRGREQLPTGAIYLNVAQHAFEFHRFFEWLGKRADVRAVFLVHDLLPLDYPEYFRPGYEQLFDRRVETVLRHASALIATSRSVAERLELEYRRRGRAPLPIHVEPLPSSLPVPPGPMQAEAELSEVPYFLALGTIEPRKNHLLLLNIWRQLAQSERSPPKLLIVGARGWENEQVLDVLDRGRLTRPHVLAIKGLGDEALAILIRNARALLMPSFAEGYGLPVVEALSLNTPVIASDIPVFREVSQGRAIFRHPLDGPGWRAAIEDLARGGKSLEGARQDARRFVPPHGRPILRESTDSCPLFETAGTTYMVAYVFVAVMTSSKTRPRPFFSTRADVQCSRTTSML
jgi:glycosyltransferase involved in cell wall biosynthesis